MSDAPAVVESRESDRVLRWVLHNPKRRNAVSPNMLRWIAQRCGELRGEVVVIEGEGELGFCSGFDLTELAVEGAASPDETLIAATDAMVNADATFVASITGHVIGAGVELACTCDFRIATPDVTFRVPAGRLCVVYHAAGLARMHATLGATLTRSLVLAGDEVSAEQADAAGALYRLVPATERASTTQRLCESIASQAPGSVRGNRRLLRALDEKPLPDDLVAAHEEARARTYRSADHAEARAAVRERRAPKWRDE